MPVIRSRFDLFEVDGPAAQSRPAFAGYVFNVFGEMVIDGQLLAFADRAAAHVKNMAFPDNGDNVRVAAVVDVFGAAAAHGAVESPVIIEREQIDHPRLLIAAPLRLAAADAFSGVLDDLPSRGNVFAGVNPPPVDLRRPDQQSEAGEFGSDRRLLRRLPDGHLAIVAAGADFEKSFGARYRMGTESR